MAELAPTINDAQSPDDVASFDWTFWPEHILASVDILLVHVGAHEKLVLPPVFCRPRFNRKLGDETLMRPAIPGKAITAGMMLLYLKRSHGPGDGKLYWHLPRKPDWKSRLILAGVDHDTLEVTDRRRWAFAFAQLSGAYDPHGVLVPTFSQVKQIELINSNLPTPELIPRINEFKVLRKSAKTRLKKELSMKSKLRSQEEQERGFGQIETPDTDQFGRPFSY